MISLMVLLLRAHELHADLGLCGQQIPEVPQSVPVSRELHCLKCLTFRNCPNCRQQHSPNVHSGGSPHCQAGQTDISNSEDPSNRFQTAVAGLGASVRPRSRNFRGGRTFQRGNPLPIQTVIEPLVPDSSQNTQLALGHMEDPRSSSFWNTPFHVQVNFHSQALEATLDAGDSVSAVCADFSRFVPGGDFQNNSVVCISFAACQWGNVLPNGFSLVTVWVYGPTCLPMLCCHPESFNPARLGHGFYNESFCCDPGSFQKSCSG